MKCPHCQEETRVLDSRPHTAGEHQYVKRKRVCPNNHYTVTYETTFRPGPIRNAQDRKEYFRQRYQQLTPEKRLLMKQRKAARDEAKKRSCHPSVVYKEWGID